MLEFMFARNERRVVGTPFASIEEMGGRGSYYAYEMRLARYIGNRVDS